MAAASTLVEQPFPGMRPFRPSESDLFGGQEEQVEAVLDRLDRSRFVAVLGESGCGKSSLVRAGVVPELTGTNPEWKAQLWTLVITEPKGAPLRNLAEKLSSLVHRPANDVEETIRASTQALVEMLVTALGPDRQILLIVDQFEELFTFRKERDAAKRILQFGDAAFFVSMLLYASKSAGANIYVMLTMRSEYLGDCAILPGLAEAINEGAFLLPKMSRFQCERAILKPLELNKVEIDHNLLQRLLKETVASEQDGLPLLQHTLRRLWESWRAKGAKGKITFQHLEYKSKQFDDVNKSRADWIDGIPPEDLHVLSSQINDGLELIWNSLGEDEQVAIRLFKLLGEYNNQGLAVRIFGSRKNVQTVAATDETTLDRTIARFADEQSGRYFLNVAGDQIQVAHEVLLRRWTRVREYVKEESNDGRLVLELSRRAERKRRVWLSGGELNEAKDLIRRHEPFDVWALRYLAEGEPERVRKYVLTSANIWRWLRGAAAIAAAAVLGSAFYAVYTQAQLYESTQHQAELNKLNAEVQAKNAELAKNNGALTQALNQRDIANGMLTEANGQLKKEEDDLTTANRAKDQAIDNFKKTEVELESKETALEASNAAKDDAIKQRDENIAKLNELQVQNKGLISSLQKSKDDQELASAQREIEQNLHAITNRPQTWDRQNTVEDLREDVSAAKEYSGDPGQTVISAIARDFALTFLRLSDTKASSPVILAMQDESSLDVYRLGTRREVGPGTNALDWLVHNAAANPIYPGYAAIGGARGQMMFEHESPRFVWKRHFFPITGIGYSTDGEWIASASTAGDMRLVGRSEVSTDPGQTWVSYRIKAKDAFFLVGNTAKLVGNLFVYRYKGEYSVQQFALTVPADTIARPRKIKRKEVTIYGLTEDGRLVGWRTPGPFGKLINEIERNEISKPGGFVSAIVTEPKSQDIWLGYSDGRTFDLTKNKACIKLERGGVSSLAWDAQSARLAVGSDSGRVSVYQRSPNTDQCDLKLLLEIPAHTGSVSSMVWQADTLVTGSADGSARSWALALNNPELAVLEDIQTAKGLGKSANEERRRLVVAGLLTKIEGLFPNQP